MEIDGPYALGCIMSWKGEKLSWVRQKINEIFQHLTIKSVTLC